MRDFEGEVIEDRDDDGLEENVDLKEGGALLVQRVAKVGQRRGRRRGIVAFLRRDVGGRKGSSGQVGGRGPWYVI